MVNIIDMILEQLLEVINWNNTLYITLISDFTLTW